MGNADFISNHTQAYLPSPAKFDNFLKLWGFEEDTVRRGSSDYGLVIAALHSVIFFMNIVGAALLLLGLLGTMNACGDSTICGVVVGRYCEHIVALTLQ